MSNETIIQIRKLSQLYAYSSTQMHEAIGRKAGLTGTDHKYLGFLIQKGRMTAGELTTLTGMTAGAVTGLIDRFEKKKLVKRRLDKNDRRKVFIEPNTANIVALLEPLYKDFQDSTDELFASFSDTEIKTLEAYFLKAIEIMNEKTSSLRSGITPD